MSYQILLGRLNLLAYFKVTGYEAPDITDSKPLELLAHSVHKFLMDPHRNPREWAMDGYKRALAEADSLTVEYNGMTLPELEEYAQAEIDRISDKTRRGYDPRHPWLNEYKDRTANEWAHQMLPASWHLAAQSRSLTKRAKQQYLAEYLGVHQTRYKRHFSEPPLETVEAFYPAIGAVIDWLYLTPEQRLERGTGPLMQTGYARQGRFNGYAQFLIEHDLIARQQAIDLIQQTYDTEVDPHPLLPTNKRGYTGQLFSQNAIFDPSELQAIPEVPIETIPALNEAFGDHK